VFIVIHLRDYLAEKIRTGLEYLSRWFGIVVVVSANGAADGGFESRQDVRSYEFMQCNVVLVT
jgi:hypothetical protein